MTSEFAAFHREPVIVTVAGEPLVLPYRPAAVWASGIERLHILAAVLADPPGRERIADLIIDYGPEARTDLRAESLRILAEATGRKWWEAGRLISTSAAPEILGRLVLAGVDSWTRSIGEWTAATYALCVKGHDEKARLKFDFSLSLPPRGHEDEWDDEGVNAEATMAAMAQMGMGG